MPRKPTEDKHDAFCREYLKDFNATQAYLRAGYTAKDADVAGPRLLRDVRIQAKISALRDARAKKCDVTVERTLAALAERAYPRMGEYITTGPNGTPSLDIERFAREHPAMVQEVTTDSTGGSGDGERRLVLRTKVKGADQLKALEMLCKYLKLFSDAPNVNLTVNIADSVAKKIAEVKAARGLK